MKKWILACLLVWTMASCQQETYDTAAIRTAVHGQMEAFPASRLQDLYKSFFQDRFGPGHIIDDRQSARDYISYELSSADTLMGPEVFPCGWEGNYVRVNLSLLAEGRITVDELTDVLMESAKPVEAEAVELWKGEWKAILAVVEHDYPNLPDMQQDKARIDSLLAAGEYAYHHSEAFEAAYHPHYRIIDRQVLNAYRQAIAGNYAR